MGTTLRLLRRRSLRRTRTTRLAREPAKVQRVPT